MTTAGKWILAMGGIFILTAAAAIPGCGEGQMGSGTGKNDPIGRVPASAWEKLSSRKIYFGHQSVGNNIMEGVRAVLAENPGIRLTVVEGKGDAAAGGAGVFVHEAVGKNKYPETKLQDFAARLSEGAGKGADIAFVKFCYVDVVPGTDVAALFAEYKGRMAEIRKRHPGTTIVHVTVPLVTEPPTLKNAVKKLLGRGGGSCGENEVKNRYNELLLAEFGGREPVFDLARLESTKGDGTRVTCSKDGKVLYCLNPEYTDDGGHLNAAGRKAVASELLVLLAGLAANN